MTTAPTEAAKTKVGHAYPSSSKKQTNWDALVKQDAADEAAVDKSKDPNASGDADVNKLFQTLYADATDEQRKAMVKSYSESNGTALSTDWDTVKVVSLLLHTAADNLLGGS